MTERDIMMYLAGMMTMVFFRWFSKTIKLINEVDRITVKESTK